jgi:hypothetical protein
VELEGSQNLDVSQSLNARVSVMVHADGWLELMHVLASWGFGTKGSLMKGWNPVYILLMPDLKPVVLSI